MEGRVAGQMVKLGSRRRGPAGAAIASLSRHVQKGECLAAAAAADQVTEEWWWEGLGCRRRSVVGGDDIPVEALLKYQMQSSDKLHPPAQLDCQMTRGGGCPAQLDIS